MPWNDNANPGPWGSPPSSNDDEPRQQPVRKPPAPPPPPPHPDFAEYLKRAQAEWGRLTRGRRADRLAARLLGVGAAALAALWILSGFYLVPASEEAIVTRYGAFERAEGPGPHYRLPAPMEDAQLVDVGAEQKLVIGAAPENSSRGLTLTGDDNMVDLVFAVRYHIADPIAWLFQVRDPEAAVRGAAESAMRQVVGHSDLAAVLTSGRGDVQAQALGLMQQSLNHSHAGVVVDAVQIQSASPPTEAVPAYQDIARAGADAQTAVGSANAYASKTIGDAQSAASKVALAASIYQQQVVHEANGEASRFDQIYAQYRQAPEVTRERLYIQTMEDVLAHARIVVISAKGAQIVLSPPAAPPGVAEAPAPNPPQNAGSPPPSPGSQP